MTLQGPYRRIEPMSHIFFIFGIMLLNVNLLYVRYSLGLLLTIAQDMKRSFKSGHFL